MITIEEARAAIKDLGEFAGTFGAVDGEIVEAIFVKYRPGARDGKFHKYKTLTLPRAVYDELKDELNPL